MYIFKDGSIVAIDLKEIATKGIVEDARISKIETIVAERYNTTVHELNVFYKDTDAKIMTCFLMHDLLHYSIGSIAVKYKINRLFLRNKIRQVYLKCLEDADYLSRVVELRTDALTTKTVNYA